MIGSTCGYAAIAFECLWFVVGSSDYNVRIVTANNVPGIISNPIGNAFCGIAPHVRGTGQARFCCGAFDAFGLSFHFSLQKENALTMCPCPCSEGAERDQHMQCTDASLKRLLSIRGLHTTAAERRRTISISLFLQNATLNFAPVVRGTGAATSLRSLRTASVRTGSAWRLQSR